MATIHEIHYKRLKIPYYQTIRKINGNIFQKYFMIDIRNWSPDFLSTVFSDFEDFQSCLLSNEFFYNSDNKMYPVNLMLYFVIEEDKDYGIDIEGIKYNFEFAFKDFINHDQFVKFTQERDLQVPQRTTLYTYDSHQIEICNFNLIFGGNGSGKSRLLTFLSEKENLPIFCLYKDFNSKQILTSASERIANFKQIIDYGNSNHSTLLLDDFGWGSFDKRNKMKIIDQLYDYSQSNNIIFTAPQQSIKRLVKARYHSPNILEVEKLKTTQ